MKPRNSRDNQSRHSNMGPDANFSRRHRDESPNQWTAYGRSDSDRADHGSYRADQTDWTASNRNRSAPRDYDTSRDTRARDSLNPYPHSYSEYDTHHDMMDARRYGAYEGGAHLHDRSHIDYPESRELYRPGFDESARPTTSYHGRGPKGFKRSDERIKEEVCELLTRDHSIDAEDIDVEVKEGEVTLSGTVPDRRMKHMAEDCVERALGVKDVINNVRVKKHTSSDTKPAGNSSSSTAKSNH